MICFRLIDYQIKLIRGKRRESYLYKNHTFYCMVATKKKNYFSPHIAMFIKGLVIF